MSNLIYGAWRFGRTVSKIPELLDEQARADQRIAQDRANRAKSNLVSKDCPISHHRQLSESTSPDTLESHEHVPRHIRLEEEKERMLADGWCCHQVDYLASYYPESFSYFAALGRSPFRLEDHTPCATKLSCVAYNTNDATYQTRHVSAECACPMIQVPYDDLIHTIKNRFVPLLSIESQTDDDAEPRLRVHSRTGLSSYIAISHVWADGLGNPLENALPTCQVRKLQVYLAELHKENDGKKLYLWMDTLCIPPGAKPQHMALRLSQIDKMSSIYKGAALTLVLDHELMQTESYFSSTRSGREGSGISLSAETRARIASSVWMRRSWTLQEGQLPPKVAIKFKNDIVLMGRMSFKDGSYCERSLTAQESSVSAPSVSAASDPPTDAITGDPPCECVNIALEKSFYLTFCDDTIDFVSAWNSLAGRSTTQPRDVPLIMTNILDLENTPLLEYNEAYQMFQAIILSLASPPLSIFFNGGPRHDQEGNHKNRWVPREIGQDILSRTRAEDGILSVNSTDITYSNYNSNVYWVDTVVVPPQSKVHLCYESGYGMTTSEATWSVSDADRLDITLFAATLFIFENPPYPSPRGRRGACFYTRETRHPHTISKIDLTFVCPILVEETGAGAHPSASIQEKGGNSYLIQPVSSSVAGELRIQFDLPPGFHPLARRKPPSVNAKHAETVVSAICFPLALASIVLTMAFVPRTLIREKEFPTLLAYIIGIFAALGAYLLVALIGNLVLIGAKKYEVWLRKWRYVESFEAIAARRREEVRRQLFKKLDEWGVKKNNKPKSEDGQTFSVEVRNDVIPQIAPFITPAANVFGPTESLSGDFTFPLQPVVRDDLSCNLQDVSEIEFVAMSDSHTPLHGRWTQWPTSNSSGPNLDTALSLEMNLSQVIGFASGKVGHVAHSRALQLKKSINTLLALLQSTAEVSGSEAPSSQFYRYYSIAEGLELAKSSIALSSSVALNTPTASHENIPGRVAWRRRWRTIRTGTTTLTITEKTSSKFPDEPDPDTGAVVPSWHFGTKMVFRLGKSSTVLRIEVHQYQVSLGSLSLPPKFVVSNIIPSSSAVFEIAKNGSVEELEHLFAVGQASLHDCDENSASLLYYASSGTNAAVCDYLVQRGFDVDEVIMDADGNEAYLTTPLLLSLGGNEMETCNVLLTAGADPTMKISIRGQLKSVIDEMSDNMTPKSPNRSNKGYELTRFLFHHASHFGVTSYRIYGYRPLLHNLCDAANMPTWLASSPEQWVNLFLDQGCRTDDRRSIGTCLHVFFRSLIHRPSELGWQKALIQLVRRGADVHAVDFWGQSVSEIAYAKLVCHELFNYDLGSYRGDLWDSVLHACDYNIEHFRKSSPRIARYTPPHYTRHDFEKLWEGRELECPYWDDSNWPGHAQDQNLEGSQVMDKMVLCTCTDDGPARWLSIAGLSTTAPNPPGCTHTLINPTAPITRGPCVV
ncbi:hypothetical protein F4818DRAFT_445457 [Hypoxylon cercidicola]|nr:hypothetical protein F4818DRAFT_445457 [Hypoxylon cercidicola]